MTGFSKSTHVVDPNEKNEWLAREPDLEKIYESDPNEAQQLDDSIRRKKSTQIKQQTSNSNELREINESRNSQQFTQMASFVKK